MAKSTRRKIQMPCHQPGNVVSTRYGIGVILHAFIGSIHRNRQITYSVAIKGLIRARVLFERELTLCQPEEIAATAVAEQAKRPAQLAAA